MQLKRLTKMCVPILGVAALLTGCTSSGVTYSGLDGKAEAVDELPEIVQDSDAEIDVESARFVGEQDGASVWLARGEQPDTVCLVASEADDWVVSCGAEGGPMTVAGEPGKYVVVPDGAPAPENATELSDNVYFITG